MLQGYQSMTLLYFHLMGICSILPTPSAASLRNPCSRARRVLAKLHWADMFLLAFLGDYQWGQKKRIYIIYISIYINKHMYKLYNVTIIYYIYTCSYIYIYILYIYKHCGTFLWMHGILGPMANSEQFGDLSDRPIPMVRSPWTLKWVKPTDVTCISGDFWITKTSKNVTSRNNCYWMLQYRPNHCSVSWSKPLTIVTYLIHALLHLLQWNPTMERTKRSPSLLRDEGQITCRVTGGAIFKKAWGRLIHTLLVKPLGSYVFCLWEWPRKDGLNFFWLVFGDLLSLVGKHIRFYVTHYNQQ